MENRSVRTCKLPARAGNRVSKKTHKLPARAGNRVSKKLIMNSEGILLYLENRILAKEIFSNENREKTSKTKKQTKQAIPLR